MTRVAQGGPPPPGPGQGGPPRDARPAQTGTAVIRGRAFAADTGRPLRRARIMLTAPELGGENRTTSTNAEGKDKNVPDGWIVKAILQDGRDISDTAIETRNGDTLSGLQVVLSNGVSSVGGQLTVEKGAPLADGTIN